MTNKLEDKIKECENNLNQFVKELENRLGEKCLNCEVWKIFTALHERIEKQNSELKSKLDNVKYMDRDTIDEIIYMLNNNLKYWHQNQAGTKEQNFVHVEHLLSKAVDDILSLAIPIDKDKIIIILKKYNSILNGKYTTDVAYKTIAEEIITGIPAIIYGGTNNQVIDIYSKDGEILNNKE